MASERELKLAVDDMAQLRQRLRACGATTLHEESFEDNQVWDRRGELHAAGELLRLRTDGHGVRLTYKGPPSYEDGVKVRTELETTVASAASLEAILTALGYTCVRRYQKYREEWQLDGVIVALDRTPMGTFVEFEGEGAVEVALRCECDLAEALEADYLALYDAFRRRHPAAPADMVFDTAGPEDG
ncbi:MAG: class IV adenylate cyclase [Acidobacteria bacterium]|nr:class IV adenylate cyclase [Acidobacteriota bacterium]